MVSARQLAPLCALVLLSCNCDPEGVGSKKAPDEPPEPARKTGSKKIESLELDMDQVWKWEAGCGEGCRTIKKGSSDVSLAMLADGMVQAMDTGSLMTAQTSEGMLAHTTRSWTATFLGTWKPSRQGRTLALVLDTHDCTETFDSREATSTTSTEQQRECPEFPPSISMTCVAGRVDLAGGGSTAAWLCGADRPVSYPGTDLPWVFGMNKTVATVEAAPPPDGELSYEIVDPPGPPNP